MLRHNYDETLEQWRILTKDKKMDIVVIDMPLPDTKQDKNLIGAFLGGIVLQVLSFVEWNEGAKVKQRKAKDIAAAKARGVRFGKPSYPLL